MLMMRQHDRHRALNLQVLADVYRPRNQNVATRHIW
jgi:hypothetical protein